MEYGYKELGKVSITANGVWDRANKYDRLCLVSLPSTGSSFLSKKEVPVGIDISNADYWQPITAGGYKDNNIIILADYENDKLKVYTLEQAIASIHPNDRKPGLVLGFYGATNGSSSATHTWYMYQFNSDDTSNWDNIFYWTSIYNNVDKFKGYFENGAALNNAYPTPFGGDYAFVGKDLPTANLYYCSTNGVWEDTGTPALNIADRFGAIYSKDVDDFDIVDSETIADRARRDIDGNPIEHTYVKLNTIDKYLKDVITKHVNSSTTLAPGSIKVEHLSNLVKQLIGGGSLVNYCDQTTIAEDDAGLIGIAQFSSDYSAYQDYGVCHIPYDWANDINIFQNKFIEDHMIYRIRYRHDLRGRTIVVPPKCTLDLTWGGKLENGTLQCDDTIIVAYRREDIDVTLTGTYTLK